MENIPQYVAPIFIAVVLSTLGFLYFAINHAAPEKKTFLPTVVTTFIVVWLFLISLLTFNGFFRDFNDVPPRFIWILFPPLAVVGYLVGKKSTRIFLQKMPMTTLTYIHIVRVPVEMVLWWLAAVSFFPDNLTFEGVNYDIMSGISAPFAAVFLVGMRSKSRIGIIIWNVLALALLFNIVLRAISATPYFYDPEVYNVPNQAVFYFPYVLLPGFIVPVVFFSHLVSLIKLFGPQDEDNY